MSAFEQAGAAYLTNLEKTVISSFINHFSLVFTLIFNNFETVLM